MLRKLLIAPVFLLLSVTGIIVFHFTLRRYNLIPFPLNFAGILISFGGFGFMGKSYFLFGRHNMSPSTNNPPVLITHGIYRRTRNPMYLGMFILLFGLGLASRNLASMAMAFVFVLLINFIVIPREEKDLSVFFGEEFDQYRKQVRRWHGTHY